jgi:tRNA A-37 threonylcarbamoyl transferase component Bud32
VATEGGIQQAFGALAALHACRVFHGDARTANLLVVEGRALWIDLRTGIVGEEGGAELPLEQQQWDAEVLACSVLARPQALPQPVREALRLYNAAQPATAVALAKAVWRAL